MSTLTANKYFGEARYKEAKRIEEFREIGRWFQTPDYMTPPTKGLPEIETGKCCALDGSWMHFVKHLEI